MKKKLIKSGAIATGISIVTGIINLVLSFFGGKSIIGNTAGAEKSIPWGQILGVMLGVFVIVFVVLLFYYFVLKKDVENINT
jgi:uncharacterized membrane protein YdcZ (DUF606 family)